MAALNLLRSRKKKLIHKNSECSSCKGPQAYPIWVACQLCHVGSSQSSGRGWVRGPKILTFFFCIFRRLSRKLLQKTSTKTPVLYIRKPERHWLSSWYHRKYVANKQIVNCQKERKKKTCWLNNKLLLLPYGSSRYQSDHRTAESAHGAATAKPSLSGKYQR